MNKGIFTCGNNGTTEASHIALRHNLLALRAQHEGPLISLSKEQNLIEIKVTQQVWIYFIVLDLNETVRLFGRCCLQTDAFPSKFTESLYLNVRLFLRDI